MKISLFGLKMKAAIACIAAAITLSAAPRTAEAQILLGYGSTFEGFPGATVTYSPDFYAGYFSTTVYTGADVGFGEGEPVAGMVNGPFVSLSLGASADTDAGVEAAPYSPDSSVYVQNLQGMGSFEEVDTASGTVIADGDLVGGEIFATPGQPTAAVSFDVAATIAGPEGPEVGPVVGYLVLSGATLSSSPVSLTNINPLCTNDMTGACIEPYFNQFTLDFTATYQATPYAPPSGKAVPEVSTWAMLILGFAGLGFAGRRASRRRGTRLPASLPRSSIAHLDQSGAAPAGFKLACLVEKRR